MRGNISANEVTQEAHYYPFGMRIEATDAFVPTLANAIPYLYNGIEYIGDLGLNRKYLYCQKRVFLN